MTRTTFALLTFAGLLAAGTSLGAATTLTGTISDAMCGAKHPVADAAGCTRDCVKKGADYALVTAGGKVYTLKASGKTKSELDTLAGKMANISGDVNGTTMQVTSAKKATAKQ